MEKDELEERIREARKYRAGDHCGYPLFSDEWRNFSADGREAGIRAAEVFRSHINKEGGDNV